MPDGSLSNPEPIGFYREVPAWVLMADPGAGKTDVFETLANTEGGHYTTARDFVDLEWSADKTGTLFIDGLDEVTAGSEPGTAVLGKIRSKLQQLGTPKFRISCREADWRGSADSAALQRLVGDKLFQELHLTSLNQEQMASLVAHWQQSDTAAATSFIRTAEEHDLEGLLDNPQTLRMLVKAIQAKGNWPTSKTETYAMACAQLVEEQNDEHQATQHRTAIASEQLLKAAGYLSAVLLLSGNVSITLRASVGSVALTDLIRSDTAPSKAACQAALHTRLFRGPAPQFTPVHRTVAEYLGAQYLAGRIHAGLPILRVLALMQGEDGGIVPALRGLHAWLAACLTGEARRTLIDRDPLGLVLNGDVRNFTRGEKLQLLQALHIEASRYTYFRSQNWTSHPFGALATKDIEADFKALLESPDRSPPHLALLDCVLDALEHGDAMPALSVVLERVVRDKSYWPSLRKDALQILVAYTKVDGDWPVLTQLLTDVFGGVVEDSEDELLGVLLRALYPAHIEPKDVWHYYRHPKADHLLGSYQYFWHILGHTAHPPEDISALLDGLVAKGSLLRDQSAVWPLDMLGALLVCGLAQCGEKKEVGQLLKWLRLGVDGYHDSRLGEEQKTPIRQWLVNHPHSYKALFEHGICLPADPGESAFSTLWKLDVVLYDAAAPDDAPSWYRVLSEACTDNDLRRALLSRAFRFVEQKNGADAAIQYLEDWSTWHPSDAMWIDDYLQSPYPPAEERQRIIDSKAKNQNQQTEATRKRINDFREALPSFTNGPAHLGALVAVANAYLRATNEKSAHACLLELLNNDEDWVRQALHGLRQCLFRDDLPTVTDILNIYEEGRRYNLTLPCLAAMALRDTENPATALDLPLSVLEVVAAFRLIHPIHETPHWFKQLLVEQPTAVANTLQCLIQLHIAKKMEHDGGLYALVYDPDYGDIAKQITPSLVSGFPIKARQKQLKSLVKLIVSVLQHQTKDQQLSVIASKLSIEGMDIAQRVYWVTAGVLVAPESYLPALRQFIAKSQLRAKHVFELLLTIRKGNGVDLDLPIAAQTFLIELLGPKSNPREEGDGWVSPAMEMADYVKGLISALTANPSADAQQALATLQQDPGLHLWHDSLRRAVYEQRIARRKALFAPASVKDVCATLANLKPANAADVWALTVAHLTQLIAEIRNGNTNDYRQYWADDKPKVEDDCRDALLSDLKQRLALVGVDAEREGHYADAKRADIKVIANPHHIPIEIKREMHPDVWTAIGGQLVEKYGRELVSDGYGIFVVFWFTGLSMPAPNDGGTRPKTPQELQQRLAATVPESLRHKIAVLVVDCSKPSAKVKPSP